MSKFNKGRRTQKTFNKAGGRAYKHGPEMELIVSVLTTFLEDKFYESGDERMERLQELVQDNDPVFVAKLAIMARRDFHLRSVSHLLVGELAKTHRGDDLVSRVVEIVAERPDDLTELVAYLGKPIPKQIKRGIRHALLKYSPYQLAKYRGDGKDVKLVDLFNLTHPNPKYASKEQKTAWKELMTGKLKNEDTWEARLSAGENKKKVWKSMLKEGELGYMALLRNLRNIDEQADEITKKLACEMISDPEQVKKSKQLPFRFYSAYEQVENRQMRNAISDALEYSLANVPDLPGKTLIAVDSSGSMSGDPIKKASIFAAALAQNSDSEVILYDTQVKELRIVSKTPTLVLAEAIQQKAMGGGTETSLVFRHAGATGEKYKRIIILSDNESWNEYIVQPFYEKYKEKNDCYVYAIDIAGYGTKDIKGNRVYHLAGWSEKIFDFMSWIEKENQLVDFVKQIEINAK